MIKPLNEKNFTLADIIVSAQASALKAFQQEDPLAVQTTKLEEFSTTGLGREDFGPWEQAFNAALDTLGHMSKQAAPSVVAAQKAATAAAAKTPAA